MKLDKFDNTKILVIGDLMLDEYIFGDVERISPEAPVQIVNTNKEFCLLGGSGNVIRNLSTLGANVFVSSVVDCRTTGKHILSKLSDLNINTDLIEKDCQKISSKKTRIFSSTGQQLLRTDKETIKPINKKSEKNILFNIKKTIKDSNIDIIIISDYNKGVLTKTLTRNIISLANRKNIPTIVDPKSKDFYKYRGATIITPNEKEAIDAIDVKDINQCGKHIQMYDIKNVLITRGKGGMTLFEKTDPSITIPTKARSVYDVSGAGDTVVATLAIGLASGFPLIEAAKLANTAAGIVIGKIGVSTVTKRELIDFDTSHKLKTHIAEIAENERNSGKTIVFTNGCFDLIHAGHAVYLEAAKQLGDILIVGVNSDTSIKKIKGKNRPISEENHRIKVLSAFQCVDYISIFNEETPLNLIREVKPDILVKASDYTKDQIVGKDFVESYGGKTKIIDITEKISTTSIIEKVKEWKKS